MTSAIIITICGLLLISYVFDLTSSKTKIPSVIMLLFLGWAVGEIASFLNIKLPGLTTSLPVLGTIGLILIVLEGALELELNRSKVKLIRKSFFGALIPMLGIAFLLAYGLHVFLGYPFRQCLANAIPFSVISSAIAIPSVRNLKRSSREFIIYESSLSDILGVLFFNFIVMNTIYDHITFGQFGLQILIIVLISFVSTVGLSYLISKIEHHIKFMPIILLIILIYTVSKHYHLPALIIILVFGLFLGNIDELKRFKWINKLNPEEFNEEVSKFKELTIEAAFLVRSVFFLVFGYLINTSEIFNWQTIPWAIGISIAILLFRALQLKVSNLPGSPLLYVAPRGLITILLYLSIDDDMRIELVNRSLVIQVIIISAFVMMFGLMTSPSDKKAIGEIKAPEAPNPTEPKEDKDTPGESTV